MNELGSCKDGISGEHLISESIMRLLAGDGEFKISGLPWLPLGEFKSIGFKSLTANCLCVKHNSCLHSLDDAALAFFTALKSCMDKDAKQLRFIVSGHDIERWLLKTIKVMATSGNLSQGQVKLSGEFASDVRVIEMLDNPHQWSPGTGLYCVMNAGDLTQNHNLFKLAPLTNQQGEISGLWTNMMGLSFVLVLEPWALLQIPQLAKAVYRPGQIIVTTPNSANWIVLSWDDGFEHEQTMSLKFVSPAYEDEWESKP